MSYYEINGSSMVHRTLGPWNQTEKGNPYPSRINVLKSSNRTLSDHLVQETANVMELMLEEPSVLVPVPRSTPGQRPSMQPVIEALGKRGDYAVEHLLRRDHEPNETEMLHGRERPTVQSHTDSLSTVVHPKDADLNAGPIMLVDDVLSTGRTVAGCKNRLKEDGWHRPIYTVSLQAGDGVRSMVRNLPEPDGDPSVLDLGESDSENRPDHLTLE